MLVRITASWIAICTLILFSNSAFAADRGFRKSAKEYSEYLKVMEIVGHDFGGPTACAIEPWKFDKNTDDPIMMMVCTYPMGFQVCVEDKGEHCFDTGSATIEFSPTKVKFKKKTTKVKIQGQTWIYDRCDDVPEFTQVLYHNLVKKDVSWEISSRSTGMTIDLRKRCSKQLKKAAK